MSVTGGQDHIIRAIDRFVDLSDIRRHLAPLYSSTGRPSVDPELMIRMLLVDYTTAGVIVSRGTGFENLV